MSEAEIKAIVDELADIARVLKDADPEDKGEIFRQLGLKLTYHPGRRLVQPAEYGFFDGVRGGLEHANRGRVPKPGKKRRPLSGSPDVREPNWLPTVTVAPSLIEPL